MAKLTYKMVPEGMLEGKYVPLNIAFIDYREVRLPELLQKRLLRPLLKPLTGLLE